MKTSIRVLRAVAICLIAVITAAAIYLAAQLYSGGVTVYGSSNCGQWISGKTEWRRAWLLGFLSGLSSAEVRRGNPLSALSSAEEAYAWIDKYCSEKPLGEVSEGAVELFEELAVKAKTHPKVQK
jgi:hypothetical protein